MNSYWVTIKDPGCSFLIFENKKSMTRLNIYISIYIYIYILRRVILYIFSKIKKEHPGSFVVTQYEFIKKKFFLIGRFLLLPILT